jgi:D-beta-D-heptose 7-phosphate kinase/D-beta-D-heptose 1-phosphate adenosyltransferase
MAINIAAFTDCRILVVGDLMIDEYIWGTVDRISPEAPVQVVSVTREDFTLGGAGNVINNLIALGAQVWAMGVIGTGTNGRIVREKLNDLGVQTDGVVTESKRMTTRKTRIIAAHQHVLRIDRETRADIDPKSFKNLVKEAQTIIPAVDVVLVSDYAKGLLTPEFLERLIELAKRHSKPLLVDPKGIDYTKYAGASLLKPNQKEAAAATGIDIIDQQTLFTAGRRLVNNMGIKRVLITCGKDGMVLFEPKRKPYVIHTEARQVFDVSGAGDTVLSVLGLALAAGASYRSGMELANTAAGLVVSKVGTATIGPRELESAIHKSLDAGARKYASLSMLETICKDLKRNNRKIVLTNGCFDLLHAGHIMLLNEAKKLGDILVVAIDDDDSVRRLKGPNRPVIRADQRVKMMAALDDVDYVTIFKSESLAQLVASIQPDVLTKGSNYKNATIIGQESVEKSGGRVVLIPISEDVSSSGIIDKIKNAYKSE